MILFAVAQKCVRVCGTIAAAISTMNATNSWNARAIITAPEFGRFITIADRSEIVAGGEGVIYSSVR